MAQGQCGLAAGRTGPPRRLHAGMWRIGKLIVKFDRPCGDGLECGVIENLG